MNTRYRFYPIVLALAATVTLTVGAAQAGEPTPAGPAKTAAAKQKEAAPLPRQSPYARAAREDAQAGNTVVAQVQADGKLAAARKSVPRDQAQAGASRAKSVQRRGVR
jgi:hypothetical protein